MLILGIETSCDETAAAVVRNGREVLSNIISSQIDIHKRFGGVVPEIASRNHTMQIDNVVKEALDAAGVKLGDVDAIAVTYGAGIVGALLVGVMYAKGLAYAAGKPLYAVNHIHGHIAANYIGNPDLKPPYICLIASGGHTALVKVKNWTDIEMLGETLDDACGEAFDKVSRVLGLGYPGGPAIEKLAKEGRPAIPMPKIFKGEKNYNFSYSGLKTAVINHVNREQGTGNREQVLTKEQKADIAASFQEAALDQLVNKSIWATEDIYIKLSQGSNCSIFNSTVTPTLVIAGGVSANAELRRKLAERFRGKLYMPELKYCTDNAAMIAAAAYFNIINGAKPADFGLNARPDLKIADNY